MRRRITVTAIAATALATGLIATTPALAATTGPGSTTCNGTGQQAGSPRGMQGQGLGQGMRQGRGQGAGMGQRGPGQAPGTGLTNLASGTLTATQRTALATMAEEEKLAQDAYTALAARYPESRVFGQVAKAEAQHLSMVRIVLDRYDIADPTAGKAAGSFASTAMQQAYDGFLADATSLAAAYRVGVAIETDDLDELATAKAGVTAPDVTYVYQRLTDGSTRHLAAFERQA